MNKTMSMMDGVRLAGQAWMRDQVAVVLESKAQKENSKPLDERETRILTEIETATGDVQPDAIYPGLAVMRVRDAAEVLARVWLVEGAVPEDVRETFKGEAVSKAFQALANKPDSNLSSTDHLYMLFVDGARDARFVLRGRMGYASIGDEIEAVDLPCFDDFIRVAAASISRGWGRGQIPSAAMKIFYAGDPYRGLLAMASENGDVSADFVRGAQWMRDTILAISDKPKTRPTVIQKPKAAYDAGEYDAQSMNLVTIKAIPIPETTVNPRESLMTLAADILVKVARGETISREDLLTASGAFSDVDADRIDAAIRSQDTGLSM